MNAKQKVSDVFVKCLENEGVRYVFGLPGEENEDLLFSLEKSSIKFIPTRHEQGAAFMADVWGRLSGKAGVCLGTLGPGATNLITGVADANLDKSPLVAITGQASRHQIHKESHQHLDVVNIFRPITKWNASIAEPEVVTEIVRKAFKTAESEKPGATHIELPEDVARLECALNPLPARIVRRPAPDYKAIEAALKLFRQARRPLILAGNGAVRKLASKQLREMSSKYGIPVAHTFMGQGAVSDRSDESLHSIGLGFRDHVMDALDQSDLIVAVGYDLAEYAPEAWNPEKNKRILHIDFTPAEVDSCYSPEVEISADVAATLWELNRRFETEHFEFEKDWFKAVQKRIREDIASYELKESEKFTVPGVLNVLRRVMAEDDLLISDVGAHKLWIARNFPVYVPNGCLISNGLASMGISLPGGIAAALHDPKRRIVAAMGDGGFLMNVQELETAKRVGAAFVVLVFNDNDYGLISWKQRMSQNRATGTRLTNPDFKKLAESFGILGYQPQTLRELNQQLKEALDSHKLCVMEIPVDPNVNDELSRRLKKYVKEGLE